jgi:alkylhydroperoxidase family enzyme
MTPRLNPFTASPAAMQPWIDLGKTIQNDGLEPLLKELVMMRTSQINGCASASTITHPMPAGMARPRNGCIFSARGASPRFIPTASGQRSALTLVSETHAPDDAYEVLRRHFTEEEQVKLTLLIGLVNAWNRINIGFRAVHPAEEKKAA